MKKISLYLFSFFILHFICKTLTDGFSPHHLLLPTPSQSMWNIQNKADSPYSFLSQEALFQEYKYLGHGKQAYVFLSEDGKHVLKLFKSFTCQPSFNLFGKTYSLRMNKMPWIHEISSFLYPKDSEAFKNLCFQSYVNAGSLLSQETLVEYLHLAETPGQLPTQFKLYDKIGVLHILDLNKTCFLIQKKTDLLYPTLSRWIDQGNISSAKQLLRNFIKLYFHFIELGIKSPSTVEENIGCIGTDPVAIDVGRLLRLDDKEIPLEQIYSSTRHMKKWLSSRSLELQAYLEKEIEVEMENRTVLSNSTMR
ncbi:MAG: hypothetical protein FJZ58_08350 [Chlamydiae bacterium]|nr:hypothetical protein [Chlamydiota bacterium]